MKRMTIGLDILVEMKGDDSFVGGDKCLCNGSSYQVDGRPAAAPATGSEFLNFQNRDSIIVEESKPIVELGFKEARPWPENAKFQICPSLICIQRKVAYAHIELHNCIEVELLVERSKLWFKKTDVDKIKRLYYCRKLFAAEFEYLNRGVFSVVVKTLDNKVQEPIEDAEFVARRTLPEKK
ncbi:hypothetical protein PIB30_058880 [Stylosanthes scabra]|uniref:Uncharacterized protein n=1 Tax=Stylosanthes scabra TaxID=79078 RepID=A0ABU6WJY1_9FABA|nr:hypothetical protein [Stylosanthes scabra]